MKERIKRPEPERTAPVRNWGTVFGPPARVTPPGVGGAPPGGPVDPVSRGVEVGYRVIDEYLRQGQAAARAAWAPFFPNMPPSGSPGGGRPFTAGAREQAPGFTPPFAPPLPEDMQQRMGTMLRYATDLAMMWMDFLGMGAPGARPAGTGPFAAGAPRDPQSASPEAASPERPAPSGHKAPPPPDQATVITLEIASLRPVEVSVDLRPGSAGLALVAHDLRAPEVEQRITGIAILGLPEEDRVIIRLRVPDDLPPGVYSGLVIDSRSSLPRGSLSLRLTA